MYLYSFNLHSTSTEPVLIEFLLALLSMLYIDYKVLGIKITRFTSFTILFQVMKLQENSKPHIPGPDI